MLKLNYRVAGGGCMTIYELNDKLELSNGRARKEVSKNEVIIVNMMMLGLICKYIQKENYSKLAVSYRITCNNGNQRTLINP